MSGGSWRPRTNRQTMKPVRCLNLGAVFALLFADQGTGLAADSPGMAANALPVRFKPH